MGPMFPVGPPWLRSASATDEGDGSLARAARLVTWRRQSAWPGGAVGGGQSSRIVRGFEIATPRSSGAANRRASQRGPDVSSAHASLGSATRNDEKYRPPVDSSHTPPWPYSSS